MKVLQTDYRARGAGSRSPPCPCLSIDWKTCLYTHILNLETRAINRRMIFLRIVESARCLLNSAKYIAAICTYHTFTYPCG